MSNVNEVVVSYLAAWNERDEERRWKLVAKTGPRRDRTWTLITEASGTPGSTR